MSDDAEYINIGRFYLAKDEDGKFRIELNKKSDACGEGGQFDEAKLEALIAAFYTENF